MNTGCKSYRAIAQFGRDKGLSLVSISDTLSIRNAPITKGKALTLLREHKARRESRG